MRRCTICRREGHNGRKHAGLTPEELATLRQDGLDYLGRGFRELDQPEGDGGQLLLDQLADQADGADQGPQPSEAKQALADVVQTARAAGAAVVVGEQGPDPLQVPGADAPDVLGPTGVIYVCATCGDPIESEPCRRHQPAAWAEAVGNGFASGLTTMAELRATAPHFNPEKGKSYDSTITYWCPRDPECTDAAPYIGEGGYDGEGAYRCGVCDKKINPEQHAELGLAVLPVEGYPLADDDHHLDAADPGEPDPGSACNCGDDGDWHPVGSGGCLLDPAGDLLRPVEVVHLPGDQPAEADVTQQCVVLDPRADVYRLVGDQGPQFVPWRTVLGPAEPIRITRPGVYQLDPEEYHADPVPGGSLSNSDARKITAPGCPAQFRYDKDHRVREQKDAYDFGHVVHELVLGRGGGIAIIDHPDWRTNAAKAERAEAYSTGRAPILKRDYGRATDMAEAFFDDPYARALLQQPHKTEQALFWVDPSGVVRRGMLDILPTAVPAGRTMIIPDIKTSAEVSPDEDMERKIMDYGYHRAAATYVDGVISLGLAVDAVAVFIFQCKKPPYLVMPVRLSPRALQIGRIENRAAMATFAECQRSGVWPGYYDPEADIPEVGLPGWYEKRFDGEV